ncbi:peptide chain release factor N(5)-glutamine methyltransferase [Tropicimonas sp. IMCC6043]|uniref:peptide chain release factor N(5)-glutamine methyltransferase n=1 Tax=Tropicimonas sp. IMCC6043 TaxID=2510645 RepID=UPI00101E0491|nr:peptide chain release factor N(5)-glutamine methyltransferase [Tropicimonas sp. IMCC6043]RYH09284.1 peptide chain release factor N(5)-glutamine methyltransferase [Tropicimonas sp. IMCC6043]
MTYAEALAASVERLRAADIETPERDARRLLAYAAGLAPDRLTLHLRDAFDAEAALEAALIAREARQPVSQITGTRLFWGRTFRVTPDVLDPRPETETLIAAALEEPFARLLDLGTGSGCIALTLLAERPGATGLATDLSPAALDIARENARKLRIAADFALSDWFDAVTGRFDLILSNPPYIPAADIAGLAPETRDWEPRMALTDEGDGLACYRRIAAGAPSHLVPGGCVMVEVGPGQSEGVAALFRAAGLDAIRIHTDMDGRDRVVSARPKAA